MKKRSSKKAPREAIAPVQQLSAPEVNLTTAFILKGNSVSPCILDDPDAKVIKRSFAPEKEFPSLVLRHSRMFFGTETVLIDCRKQKIIESAGLPPNLLLIDFSGGKLKLYSVTIALAKQNFVQLFMQITGFFTFCRYPNWKEHLVDIILDGLSKDKALKKNLHSLLGDGTVTEFLEKLLSEKPECLVVMDNEREEFSAVMATYAETWGEMVKPIFIRKFSVDGKVILTVEPTLAELQREKPNERKEREPKVIHDEAHHFEKGTPATREIYEKLKAAAMKMDKSVVFNPAGKHYISLKKNGGKNLAIFHFRKRTLYVVLMLEEKLVRKMVKHHQILTLKESVQRFWNGKCCAVNVTSTDHMKEIIEVLKKLIK